MKTIQNFINKYISLPVIGMVAIFFLVVASCSVSTTRENNNPVPAPQGEIIGQSPGGSDIVRIETENEVVFIYPGYGIAATSKCNK